MRAVLRIFTLLEPGLSQEGERGLGVGGPREVQCPAERLKAGGKGDDSVVVGRVCGLGCKGLESGGKGRHCSHQDFVGRDGWTCPFPSHGWICTGSGHGTSLFGCGTRLDSTCLTTQPRALASRSCSVSWPQQHWAGTLCPCPAASLCILCLEALCFG